MSNPMNDGGPAFPCEGGELSGLHANPGMSLRDWFAGQALAGCMADYNIGDTFQDVARTCYEIADAMLKEREKRHGD